MDVLYIPQLDEIGTGGGGDSGGEGGGGSGGTVARYRILRRVPEDGVVVLTDRAVTRVDIAKDGEPYWRDGRSCGVRRPGWRDHILRGRRR